MKTREDFELVADLFNMDALTNSTGRDTHTTRSIFISEENVIIPNRRKTGVDIRYYELDEYPSITTAQRD